MGVKYFFLVSVAMVLVWGLILFFGACVQLKQAFRNWINGTQEPITPNHVLTVVLKALGLNRLDRLTCSVWLFNALMLWPITLVLSIPLISVLRAQDGRFFEDGHKFQQPAMLSPSESVVLDIPAIRTSVNETVPG